MRIRVSVKQLADLLLWQTQHPDRSHDSYILHYSSKYRHARRGKHSAEQTQTADTLLYHDGEGFFYTWLSRLHQTNLPNSSCWISPHHKWLVSVFPFLAILNFSPFFGICLAEKKVMLVLKLWTPTMWKWLDAPKVKHTVGIFLGEQSCTLALHFSVVLNEWISGLPIYKGSRSMSRQQADFSEDYYGDKCLMRNDCWKGSGEHMLITTL